MDIIRQLEAEQAAKIEAKRKLPEFQPGDTVRVNVRVTEGTRTRVQAYEGVVIARAGSGFQENFTVRKISYGEGVERVFPVYSPMVEGVEIVRRGKVRRAKLYYLRDRRGKSARISENTGVRARKLNDAERDAAERREGQARSREDRRGSRLLPPRRPRQDAAEKKAAAAELSGASRPHSIKAASAAFFMSGARPRSNDRQVEHEPRNYSLTIGATEKQFRHIRYLPGCGLQALTGKVSSGRHSPLAAGAQIRERIMTKLKILRRRIAGRPHPAASRPMPRRCPISAAARSSW